jgi:plastocyanin
MKKLLWAAAFVALALARPASVNADIFTVLVTSNPNDFIPADITIEPGDGIVWAFISGAHSVTSDTGLFDSGIHAPPYRYRRVFQNAGEYPYYCVLHGSPGGFGHAGIVRVVPPRDWELEDAVFEATAPETRPQARE